MVTLECHVEPEIGLDTFGDRTLSSDGKLQSHAQVIRNLIEQAELADRVGLALVRSRAIRTVEERITMLHPEPVVASVPDLDAALARLNLTA